MAIAAFVLLTLAFGALCGLRTFTPLAAASVAAHLGWIHLSGTPLAFLATIPAVVILVLLALGELVVDKLPNTPSRLRPAGLIGRIFLGAISAVAMESAQVSRHLPPGVGAIYGVTEPIILGILGALLGASIGAHFRAGLVRALKCPDLPIALLEDAICIAGSILILSRV